MLDYFVETYEADMTKNDMEEWSLTGTNTVELRGRPSQPRVHYLNSHPRQARKVRVIRGDHHRTLPNIVGRWFPRRDPTSDQYPYYCASMLMLLKPWRSLRDLRRPDETWTQALERFYDAAPARSKRIISGMETIYIHMWMTHPHLHISQALIIFINAVTQHRRHTRQRRLRRQMKAGQGMEACR